jgi:hypothetical protein
MMGVRRSDCTFGQLNNETRYDRQTVIRSRYVPQFQKNWHCPTPGFHDSSSAIHTYAKFRKVSQSFAITYTASHFD